MRALDADVVIAFLDGSDVNHRRAVGLVGRVAGEPLLLSAAAYAECLVHAVRVGATDVVEGFLDAARVRVTPVDRGTARAAATLRARHRTLRLPDAITLATALEHDAELLTFDRRLLRIAGTEAT